MSHFSHPAIMAVADDNSNNASNDIPLNPWSSDELRNNFSSTQTTSFSNNVAQRNESGRELDDNYNNNFFLGGSDSLSRGDPTMSITSELSVDDITSYDISPNTLSPHRFYQEMQSMNTATLTNDTMQLHKKPFNSYTHSRDDKFPQNDVSHGFFFGSVSIPDLTTSEIHVNTSDLSDDELDEEDEGISDIYRRSGDPDMWIRQSNRSFKYSPEANRRQVISRIGNVGGIGQNIGLGHRLGVFTEDASLIPKPVTHHSTSFLITEDSPMQTDIKWSKPDNAAAFATLVYKVEISLPSSSEDDEWTELNDVRWPLFRIYHTDDKMFVGKHRVIRLEDDVMIKLRVRCHGELILPDRVRYWTMSSYSKDIEVTFAGYRPTTPKVQLTSL